MSRLPLLLLAACGTQTKTTTDLPPVVASMDYVSKTVATNHTCVDIYAASLIDSWAGFCQQLFGTRAKCTFTRGQACPTDGRHGGCVQRDGSISWFYNGEPSCLMGQAFADQPPPVAAAQPYHCAQGGLCSEITSVFDLMPTAEVANCRSLGGTFAPGACPARDATGRCQLEGTIDRPVMVFYAPVTADDAHQRCDTIKGSWL